MSAPLNVRDSAIRDPMGDGEEDEDYEDESEDEGPDWGNIFYK